ncbi:MAG: hypothetical protein JO039_08865 [Solirubrobacterales bacterium]|nr:hypothetical protein [Solirubrobacterales bacterium]
MASPRYGYLADVTNPLARVRTIPRLYRKHIASDLRKERQLTSSVSFFLSFATVRGITHAIRAGIGPFGNISPGGRHIHHMTFGIIGLLLVGYLWMLEIGVATKDRKSSTLTSGAYGAGAALTLDEFALWLNLEDVYWAKQGRESIDAVILFGTLLSMSFIGKDVLRELVRGAEEV